MIEVGDRVRTPEGEGVVRRVQAQAVPHGAHWRLDPSDPSYQSLKTYAVIELDDGAACVTYDAALLAAGPEQGRPDAGGPEQER